MNLLGFLKKKLPNWLENLLWGALIIFAMNLVVIKPLRVQLDKQNVVIEKLASQEKYKIENHFDKIKTTKDGKVIVELDNQLYDLSPITPADTIQTEPEKKGFFRRIFSNKNKNK